MKRRSLGHIKNGIVEVALGTQSCKKLTDKEVGPNFDAKANLKKRKTLKKKEAKEEKRRRMRRRKKKKKKTKEEKQKRKKSLVWYIRPSTGSISSGWPQSIRTLAQNIRLNVHLQGQYDTLNGKAASLHSSAICLTPSHAPQSNVHLHYCEYNNSVVLH